MNKLYQASFVAGESYGFLDYPFGFLDFLPNFPKYHIPKTMAKGGKKNNFLRI